MPLDVGQSSESPPGIRDLELSETEDSLWNEFPHREEQAKPILPPMLPAASWKMYKIIPHLHCLIEHLHMAHSDFKEQITICDHDTIGSFH